jgi:hypothetical protein
MAWGGYIEIQDQIRANWEWWERKLNNIYLTEIQFFTLKCCGLERTILEAARTNT